MSPATILLIDLSSIAYPIWHMSQSEPNVNHASEQIVGRIRAMAQGQPHAAVCVDSGKSFRAEIDPAYKGNRPERDERLHHQIKLAIQTLRGDGFPIWSVPGMEADDLIATAARVAYETTEAEVVIVSADKDLLQLVCPRVTAQSVKDGSRVDETAVLAKFGITPAQMRDYLTLVGDKSDNIQGVNGVGEKRAVDLLAKFGTVDGLYAQLHEKGGPAIGLTPALTTNLIAFFPNLEKSRRLITLRTDAEIDFAAVLTPREALPSTTADRDQRTEGSVAHERYSDSRRGGPDAAGAVLAGLLARGDCGLLRAGGDRGGVDHLDGGDGMIDKNLCPDCGGKMVSRMNASKQQRFWGCASYPKCKGTRDTDGNARGQRDNSDTKPSRWREEGR